MTGPNAHGLLIDARNRRAFIACDIAMDEKTRRVFVAGESGKVSTFIDDDRASQRIQAFLANTAHTVAVDSRDGTVFFPLENVDRKPVLRIMRER